jgi:hypothetical protein
MKRINLALISLLVAVSGFFTSCSSDDDNAFNEPTVDVMYTAAGGSSVTANDNDTIKKAEGTSLAFDVKFTMGDAGDKLTKITITSEISNKVYTIVDSTLNDGLFNSGDKTLTYKYNTTVGSATEKIVFSTLDKQNRKGEAIIYVKPATVAAAGSVKTTENIIMGSYGTSSEYGSCFSLELNKAVKLSGGFDQQAMIDLLYFYGSSNEASLAAPSSSDAAIVYNSTTIGLAKWSTRNDTKLLITSVSTSTFDAITSATAFTAAFPADLTASKNIANHLSVNNVVAMKTVGGKTALIKVVQITGTGGTSYIKVIVKTVVQ